MRKEVVYTIGVLVFLALFVGGILKLTGNIVAEDDLIERFAFQREYEGGIIGTLVGDKGGYCGFPAGDPNTIYNPSYVFGKEGEYAAFYNQSQLDYGILTNPQLFNPGADSFSYVLWIKPIDTQGNILHKYNSSDYYLLKYEDGKFRSQVRIQTIYVGIDSSANYNSGEWYHVAVVFDRTSNKHLFYVDGIKIGERAISGALVNNEDVRIGGTGGINDMQVKFNGYIDDLRFYRKALSESEINSIVGEANPDCVPNCAGKECGSDGCGGSCGNCFSNETCTSGGLCVFNSSICVPNWNCTAFDDIGQNGSACGDRNCTDLNFCNVTTGRPSLFLNCSLYLNQTSNNTQNVSSYIHSRDCGDGFCDSKYESELNCWEDCGEEDDPITPLDGYCGDGVCGDDETMSSCPEDCDNEFEDDDSEESSVFFVILVIILIIAIGVIGFFIYRKFKGIKDLDKKSPPKNSLGNNPKFPPSKPAGTITQKKPESKFPNLKPNTKGNNPYY